MQIPIQTKRPLVPLKGFFTYNLRIYLNNNLISKGMISTNRWHCAKHAL